MNIAITTTLSPATHKFLTQESKFKKVAKNKIIEESLVLYKQYQCAKQIKQ
jgi:hypothetical protein